MKMSFSRLYTIAAVAAAMVLSSELNAQDHESDEVYQTPPEEIAELYLARPIPVAVFNADFTMAAVTETESQWMPLQTLLSMDEHCLAGLRIDARNFSQSRHKPDIVRITLQNVAGGPAKEITGMPTELHAFEVKWSTKGNLLAFLQRNATSIDLYVVDASAESPTAVKVNDRRVNATIGTPFIFLHDGSILYKSVPEDNGSLVSRAFPRGPVMQHSDRKKGTYRTVRNVIASIDDEDDFDYLCTSEFRIWDGNGNHSAGKKAVVREYTPSPDGKYLMLVTEHKPYSYTRSHNYFPSRQFICDLNGNELLVISELPDKEKKEDTADKKDSTEKKAPAKPSRSSYRWRQDMPSTLCWNETLPAPKDTASKKDKAEKKDSVAKKPEEKPERTYHTSVWQCSAPFAIETDRTLVVRSEYSIGDVTWCAPDFAIYTDNSSKQKIRRTFSFNPSDTLSAPELLYTQSTERDTIGNAPVIGKPYLERGEYGRVLRRDGKNTGILLTGDNRRDSNGDKMAFIDRFDLRTKKTENLWTGQAPWRESVISVTESAPRKVSFISQRQSPKDVPNYCTISSKGKKRSCTYFTSFENPFPQLAQIKDTLITYCREDGVELTSRLFLPAGYDPARDGRLPVIMWTYPYEFKCPAEAEKFREDRYLFPVPTRNCHIAWATKGYAVMQGFSMPVIAKTTKDLCNDDFCNQIVMNAKAAVHAVDSLGFGDPKRVAVGGHSYGSFMTANLMVHTKLFKAGLAESGAFNRSLTPFGFQSEGRTYWQAKKVYDDMSPFNYPDKLSGHILLVHGIMDENTGTHPIQSERMYQAFAGAGKDADYLQLPYEGHGYTYTENMLHLINEEWKMWEKYLKNAKK